MYRFVPRLRAKLPEARHLFNPFRTLETIRRILLFPSPSVVSPAGWWGSIASTSFLERCPNVTLVPFSLSRKESFCPSTSNVKSLRARLMEFNLEMDTEGERIARRINGNHRINETLLERRFEFWKMNVRGNVFENIRLSKIKHGRSRTFVVSSEERVE